MSPSGAPLRSVIVGCGGMARWHARAMLDLTDYDLIACCDMDPDHASEFAESFELEHVFTNYGEMLAQIEPDVVTIVTPNNLHAPMTVQAVEAAAKGVYCEKPMATCMADGAGMVNACRERGVALAVNHQRRMSQVMLTMRQAISDGAIGEVRIFRGSCAGDLLSDATHLVDTIRFLADDAPAQWVLGQVHRTANEKAPPRSGGVQLASAGFRYGHAVETGAMAVWEFETGQRAELLCGDLRLPERSYGDYEVWGTEGRLWRPGDAADPPLLIHDGSSGGWRPVEMEQDLQEAHRDNARDCYGQFAATVREGAHHPLSGDSALKDLEIIMAIFESARLRRKVQLPLNQPDFPLDQMIAAGQL